MATERIVDLERQRYADREFEGPLPVSGSLEEAQRASRQRLALARLRASAAQHHELARDILILLGLDE
jgi:hypothetical protein